MFPGGSEDKASACHAGDLGSIPGLGRSPGEGNGNPLQYSCLENPMDRGSWRATYSPRGHKEPGTTERVHSVVACAVLCSFLWLNSIPCIDILHFIYTFISWWTFVFSFSAIMSNTAMNMCVQILCECMFLYLLARYLEVELLGHVVTLCLTFWEMVRLFSKVAIPF